MLDSANISRLHWNRDAHVYQTNALVHLAERPAAALWLSPGYGKTSIVLHAFQWLMLQGKASHMLVVAPLRVVQTVWEQEIAHWSSLTGLKAARLHGPKKETQLKRRDVNVWLVNYEGAAWLAKMAKDGRVTSKFDVVVADEVRRLKNSQGKRFKALRPIFAMANYRWGLTGTPASNGLMDLFGQFLILDGGQALGRTLTRYRNTFFEKGWDGFTYIPRPGADKQIEERVAPYVFRADGFLDLPDFIEDKRDVVLDDKARKTYDRLKRDMLSEVEGQVLTAANAAVLYGKLKQMANGRVYGESGDVYKLHDAKADALRELIEELGDEQLLIAYEYRHDLAQLREVLGDDLPYIGSGVSENQMNETVDSWNSGRIQIMAAHPASAGHGINLQHSGAHHILWWGPTIDLDFYIQFNDRLRRQGNTADAVVLHTFVAEKTVDETTVTARAEKATVQNALLSALTAEVGDAITVDTHQKETTVTQLQFNPQPDSQQGQQPQGFNPQQGQQPQGFNPQQGQQQAIQQDVAAPHPPTPNQMFAAHGIATGAEQPMGGQQAQPQGFAPQQPAQAPQGFAPQGGQPAPFPGTQQPTANPSNIPDAEVVPGPSGSEAVTAAVTEAVSAPVAGMVPFFTMVPADKLDAVLSAVGRAVKVKAAK